MAYNAVVLGSGMVGSVIAADLAQDSNINVTLADRSEGSLRKAEVRSKAPIKPVKADLSSADAIRKLIEPADVVCGALSSTLGFPALRTVIESNKPYCDISFMPEDAWELDNLARERNVTAIVDCGIAPGMSNMLAGFGAMQFEHCERIDIYVGGLPVERRWPFQYKAGFSPADVIEEYTRPARLVEHGNIITRNALTEPELLDFPGIGTLEAFNTDGLRSLAYTLNAPFMREKTLRYPGHIELMRAFRETGLFSHEPVAINGVPVKPIDLISALMFPRWTYEEGEADLTVMRIIVEGSDEGERSRITWGLLDRYDHASRTTSMARTTAFPCAIMARRILRGDFSQPGVIVPERIGQCPGELDIVLAELERRNIRFTKQVETIELPNA